MTVSLKMGIGYSQGK